MAEVVTLSSRDMSGIIQRPTTERGGHVRRLLVSGCSRSEVEDPRVCFGTFHVRSAPPRLAQLGRGDVVCLKMRAEHRYSKQLMHDCHASNHRALFAAEEGEPCCYQSDTQEDACGETGL
jgi:hypothetical protein